MKTAVLGGGPGSIAMAAHLTTLGHDVSFWARNRTKLAWLMDSRKVTLNGAINETVALARATDNLAEAVTGAEVILAPLPAPAHESIGAQVADLLENGQVVMTSSMSGLGSIVLSRVLHRSGRKGVFTAEFPGLPYGARFAGEGIVNVPLIANISESNVYGRGIGVFPSRDSDEVVDRVRELYPGVHPAENALACAFQAWGPVIHPLLMILNLTSIENFCFWDPHEEGTTPSVFRAVKTLDTERQGLQSSWGYKVTTTRTASEYYEGQIKVYDTWPNFREKMVRWAWKDRLDVNHRYLTEDAKYGMVLRISAGKVVGHEMPITEAVVRLGGVLCGEDFFETGRTLKAVGLGGMAKDRIEEVLERGWETVE